VATHHNVLLLLIVGVRKNRTLGIGELVVVGVDGRRVDAKTETCVPVLTKISPSNKQRSVLSECLALRLCGFGDDPAATVPFVLVNWETRASPHDDSATTISLLEVRL
jgi:hypothetical protein